MNIVWFRQDLRIADNPALLNAVKQGMIMPIYILDDENAGYHKMGAASRCWLHHSLDALNQNLQGKLNFYCGDARQVLLEIIRRHQISGVYWNRCYEPCAITRDKEIKSMLSVESVATYRFSATLLWDPWEVLKKDGTPYRVFTPFYRNGCLRNTTPRLPLVKPKIEHVIKDEYALQLAQLNLLPKKNWYKTVISHWDVSEEGAVNQLQKFVSTDIDYYRKGRDYPAENRTSRLSPYLHFGQISAHQIWHSALEHQGDIDSLDAFHSELGWREFSYYLLYHFPSVTDENLQSKFDTFPWRYNNQLLSSWQKGNTGYPIIDAGMRELWQTGSMHNRVRMIVASFLVKNLLIHWHYGRDWFWDCLFDADLASNSASWQWVAGCGADAAPYFRIFNPVTQSKKFDSSGEYIKKYIPELAQLPLKFLFNPSEAPNGVLADAGIVLGKNYPRPIVDLKSSRQNALRAYASLKSQ